MQEFLSMVEVVVIVDTAEVAVGRCERGRRWRNGKQKPLVRLCWNVLQPVGWVI